MGSRRRTSVFLDAHLLAGLKELKIRLGVTEAESIRRAIFEYLERQGVAMPVPETQPFRGRHRTKAS